MPLKLLDFQAQLSINFGMMKGSRSVAFQPWPRSAQPWELRPSGFMTRLTGSSQREMGLGTATSEHRFKEKEL